MAPILSALLAARDILSSAAPFFGSTTGVAANVARATSNSQAYIYAFGDSYSAIGYNASSSQQPSFANPLGIPDDQSKTTSGDGQTNWVQKLTMQHTPAGIETFTYDYAVYGALINATRYPKAQKVTDFNGQMCNFLFAGTRPAFDSAQSVAVMFWGTNDIVAYTIDNWGLLPDKTVIPATMDDYWLNVEYLYNAGVRNYVVLLADPVERAPSALPPIAVEGFAKALLENRAEWNKELLSRVETFKTTHNDVEVATLDTDPIFNDILDDPQSYGSPDNLCHNYDGTSCLWWDTLHPGQAIHTSLANNVAATLANMNFFSDAS